MCESDVLCAWQIVSGTEWHKWCFQKVKGEQLVEAKLDLRETCPACDEIIEEGQEKSIIRGKGESVTVCFCVCCVPRVDACACRVA